MRKLLNTLYVTTPEAYLSKDGLNVVVISQAGGSVPYSCYKHRRHCDIWIYGRKSGRDEIVQ